MKKALGISLILLFLTVALVLQVSEWRQTPYGQLSTPAAIIARISTWQESGSSTASVQAMRESRRGAVGLVSGPPAEMQLVQNLDIPGAGGALPLRIYTPAASTIPLPVIVYFHGGGWRVRHRDSRRWTQL